MATYTLEMHTESGWSDDAEIFGRDAYNVFATRNEANAALADLQAMWPDAEMRVRVDDTLELWIAWMGGHRGDGVEFTIPIGAECDVAAAGAAALGVDVCDELNVARASSTMAQH